MTMRLTPDLASDESRAQEPRDTTRTLALLDRFFGESPLDAFTGR